ncbi:MAG: ABC transporter permease [Candidatus Nanopelagicales bacterium]|nr:ABC transporter permease [Candidatus Nanopelagicales bacterium]MDZ4249669.1 ABC transporter permease [Candidatus Nanopelagicales bacterium]
MSTVSQQVEHLRPLPHSRLSGAIGDTLTISRRNLTRLFRVPDSIVFGIVQSVMFVLLFTYVFGGAIAVPGESYVEFLMGGIFVQTVAFSSATTTISMAEDLQRGIIDRFRSLPMAKGAVLAGRTVSDLAFSGVTVAAMAITGLLVGWRTHSSVADIVAGIALLFLFAYSFLWIGAVIGMSVRSPEIAQTAGLIWLFPLTFISNAFVPLETMPTWLQPVAEWNPISSVVLAVRELFGNLPAGYDAGGSFPMQYPILMSVVSCLVLLAVFIPLGIARYRKSASR